MKKITLLIVLIFFSFYCYSQSYKDNDISLNIKILKIYNMGSTSKYENKRLLCDISIVLINHCDKNISFYIQDCGWEMAFVTNNCKICFRGKDCSFNPCVIKEIPAGKTITYNGVLNINIASNKLENIKFKIGFKYLNCEKHIDDYCKGFGNYLDSEILWSNEKTIRVKKLKRGIK